MHLESWKRNNNKCTEYPHMCKSGQGNATYTIDLFLQKTSIDKYLCSLWFGAAGGFLSWFISSYINNMILVPTWINSYLISLYQNNMILVPAWINSYLISLYQETIIGLLIGSGLGIAFGAMIELQDQFTVFSVKKLIIRILICILSGGFSFFIGDLLFILAINSDYFGRFICWLIFGSILGGGITIYSGIEFWKGSLGGLIGSIVGFQLYYLCVLKNIEHAELGKLLGLVCLGSIIFITTTFVISKLQTFYIEYMSGKKRGFIVPISKWLRKGGVNLLIGRSDECLLNIYWDSSVCNHHAQLYLDTNLNAVLLKNINKECNTEINNRQIIKKQTLKNTKTYRPMRGL